MAAAIGGCAPLFVPPVPFELTPIAAWRIAGDAELDVLWRADGRPAGLRLQLRLEEVADAAWLAVQWYGPAGGERASASIYLTPDDAGRLLVWVTPTDLDIEPGRWRAVVSVGDLLLRQLDVVVPAGGP